MSDALPQGWATAPVSEVIEDFQPGFASGEKNVEGGVAHLRMNNIGLSGELVLDLLRTVPEDLAKPRHDLRLGDVLVCTTNSGKLVGKCAYFNLSGRYAFSNHLTRLRPKANVVDGQFLRWNLWLHWKRGVFDDKCKHWVNQSTLPKDALLEDEVVLPPLGEQRRIVAKLTELLGKVDACQQRLAKIPVLLKRFRQSVLAAACSGRLTADWREKRTTDDTDDTDKKPSVKSAKSAVRNSTRESGNAQFQITKPEDELLELPESWKWVALGNYAHCFRGRFSPRPRNDPRYFNGAHPFIQIGNLPREGGLVNSHVQTLNDEGLAVSRKFPNGTVVIAIVGATIGNTGVLAYDMCCH